MDLESYASRYSGETRLQRLLMIAQMTRNETLAQEAFALAQQQMREDSNVIRYREVFAGSRSGTATTPVGVEGEFCKIDKTFGWQMCNSLPILNLFVRPRVPK